MTIDWVPLNEPFHRRLETIVTFMFMSFIFWGELSSLLFCYYSLVHGQLLLKTVISAYLIFVLVIDRKTGSSGGRRQGFEWFRNLRFWEIYCEYFPAKLIKTVNLPPTKNYLFAAFPHGILSLGAFASFGSNATGWNKQFPGIRSKLVTLGYHFHMPFFREVIMSWGMATSDRKSIKTMLSVPNDPKHKFNNDGYTSNAVILMVGGAQEALNSRFDNYRIVLKNRKGFIRLAMQTGSDIVPVINFGEVNLYDHPHAPPGSKLRRFMQWVKNVTGIAPAFYIGRGIFQNNYGYIPKRESITTVVGSPIEVLKKDNPSEEELENYHTVFFKKLNELFETHKCKYIQNHKNVFLVME